MNTTAMTTVRGWGPLPRLVRQMAGERALTRILQRHDVPIAVLDAAQSRIPLVKMVRVFEAAARETGDRAFGRRVGEGSRLDAYGDWAAYCVGAPDLRDGLRRVCRAMWLHETGSAMFLSRRERHVVWSYATGFEGAEETRQFSDHLLKPMLDFVRAYVGAGWEPDWLEVGYASPKWPRDQEPLLNVPVRHEEPAFGLPIRQSDLGARMQDRAGLPRPLTSVDLLERGPSSTGDELRPLRDAIDVCLLDGSTDLDAVARLLDLGPRTLQRHLTQYGVTFRELLQETRRRRATALLLETDRPVKAIAADLGYGEPENFTRAFRAWEGVAPTEFRTRAHGQRTESVRDAASIVAN